MNCPYCKYESLNQQQEVNRCRSCGEHWTLKQQERIAELGTHADKCVVCGKWTCGFCGVCSEDGTWRCETCHHGRHVCADTERVAELERELAKWKLEWKEGNPKNEGNYWVQQTPFYHPVLAIWNKGKFFFGGFSGPHFRWAGPIPEPEGGKQCTGK
jgi:hypothetical protein